MDTRMIEVALGLALVFALVSLLVTAVRELWASALRSRARTLQQALTSFVADDKDFALRLMGHPLLRSLSKDPVQGQGPLTSPPSYMGADMVVTTLVALLLKDHFAGVRPASPREFVNALCHGDASATGPADGTSAPAVLKEGLASLVHGVENDWPGYEARLCAWYDAVTERSIGWFKRKNQVSLLVFGFIVAAAANINPIAIAPRLWQDGPVRQALAKAAETAGTPSAPAPDAKEVADCARVLSDVCRRIEALNELKSTGLPMGWSQPTPPRIVDVPWINWLLMLVGWCITAIAASLGAPFWFDALNKVARLRASGPPPSAADTAGTAPTPPGGTAMSLPLAASGGARFVPAQEADTVGEAATDLAAPASRERGVPQGAGFAGAALAGTTGRKPSGPEWVNAFPGSREPSACAEPFASNLQAFLNALAEARANVRISATLRPPERAYLMHWSWKIAHNLADPRSVPPMDGVDIAWLHNNGAGQPDIAKSRSAASQMVTAFGIVAQPALQSRHTEGRAVDMTIGWSGALAIVDRGGSLRSIGSAPRDGMNLELALCGKTYGVVKAVFAGDPPHWSEDGH